MRMMMTVSSLVTDSSVHGPASFQNHVTPSSFDASQFYCSNRNSIGDRSNTTTSQNSLQSEPARGIREFLERYSLPRIVNAIKPNAKDGGGCDDEDDEHQCQPVLLYRCFESFVKVKAKPFVGKKGKEKLSQTTVLHFPEGYPGLFSLVGEKGERQATAYNCLLQLVREQVCTFLNAATFTAYINIAVNMPGGQYVRTTVHPGQVLRLRAVFQHSERKPKAIRSLSLGNHNSNQRDLANRYAQLLDHNNQELYAPLTTKGEFFEVHSSMKSKLCFPGMLDKTGPLAFDKDCLYRLTNLLHRIKLPIKVKLLAGNLPLGLPIDCTDTFILEEKIQEPLLVTCTIPLITSEATQRHEINCLNLNSKIRLARTLLGFDSERRLFKSQRIQAAMHFCQNNVESWYREVRLIPNLENVQPDECKLRNLVKRCSKCNNTLNRCYCCSKNKNQEPIKSSKKWFRNFKMPKLRSNCEQSESSNNNTDSYLSKDSKKGPNISKKIEEKFLKKSSNPVKKSASFMFSPKRIDLEEMPVEVLETDSVNKKQSVAQYHSLDNQLNENQSNSYRKNVKKETSMKELNESIYCNIIEIQHDNNPPDVIPYSSNGTDDLLENGKSFISQKLRNEFHVKTKIISVKRKQKFQLEVGSFHYRDGTVDQEFSQLETDDVPYSQVKDLIAQHDEHQYAEIK